MHELTVRMKDSVRSRRFIGGEFQGKVALARIGIQTQGGSSIQIIEGASVKAHPPTGGIRLRDEILKVFVDCGMGCLQVNRRIAGSAVENAHQRLVGGISGDA